MKIIKLYLSLLVLSLFSSPSWSKEITIDDLVVRDGIYYEKFSTSPFTGRIYGLETGWFYDGKKNGEWTEWYSGGQLERKGLYKHGEKTGEWLFWYENGQLYMVGSYQNDKDVGSWTIYHTNGQVFSKIENSWSGETWIQTFEKFRNDGSRIDKGQTVSYTGNVLNQVLHGRFYSYHENNQKKSDGVYNNGKRNGRWSFFHNNGQLFRQGVFKNGQYHGDWKSYSEDGRLEYEIKYNEGKIVD